MIIPYVLSEFETRNMLRAQPYLLAALNNDSRKIDVDYQGTSKTFINMFRSGGFPARYSYHDTALMTFSCYGDSRKIALDVSTALMQTLNGIVSVLHGTTFFYSAIVQSVYYSLDTAANHERYIVTASVITRPRGATEV